MKKLIYTLLIIIALTNNSFSAGTSSNSTESSLATAHSIKNNLVKNGLILKPLNKMKKFN